MDLPTRNSEAPILGNKTALYDLMSYFSSNNYKNKCAVINALIEITSAENIEIINSFTKKISCDNLPISVIELIKKLEDGLTIV